MEPNIKFEFSLSELNLILDALLDRPARQSKVLIDKITVEAQHQLSPDKNKTED